MKLNDDMLFAHPVLSPFADDYSDALFDATFTIDLEDEDSLNISAVITLNCPDLDQLLEDGGAGCGFFVIGRQTYQNRLIEMTPGSATHSLNASHFFGTLQLRPVVWSKEERTGWQSQSLHPEYNGAADFPSATILAVGDEQRFSVDRERLKPFESIFSLVANDDLRPGEISVDAEEEKIMIYVHPETKESIDEIRGVSLGPDVLLNSVYLPAIMQVLADLAQNSSEYEDKGWHRIFIAKCAASGISLDNPNFLQNAQRLLSYPFTRIEREKERLLD